MNQVYQLLGSEFETSMRVLLLMNELSNKDLHKELISYIDFMSTYSSDFGMRPKNLHGYGAFRLSEFATKRSLISRSLKTLVLSSHISFIPRKEGIFYKITTLGQETVQNLVSEYSAGYIKRVREVLEKYPTLNAEQMKEVLFSKSIKSVGGVI